MNRLLSHIFLNKSNAVAAYSKIEVLDIMKYMLQIPLYSVASGTEGNWAHHSKLFPPVGHPLHGGLIG